MVIADLDHNAAASSGRSSDPGRVGGPGGTGRCDRRRIPCRAMVEASPGRLWPAGYPGQQRCPGPQVRPAAQRAARMPAPGSSWLSKTYPLEAWEQALDVNLTGMFLCCQAAVQPMLAQGGGVIINLSSIYGLVGPDQRLYQRPGQPPQLQTGLLLGHQSRHPGTDPLPGNLLCRKKHPGECPHPGRRIQRSR